MPVLAEELLQPATIAGVELRNRLCVSPMSRMQCGPAGIPGESVARYYARYAQEGAGLVFSEALYIDELASRAYFNQPGLVTSAQQQGWEAVVRQVHAAGGRIFAQLQHGGRLAEPRLNPLHLAASDGAAAGNTWQTGQPNAVARAATEAELLGIVEAFAASARRAGAAGFDGVEVHGARGYLVDDFLSASSNRRTDVWGGTLQGRLALPVAILRAVRAAVPGLPVSFNFSLYKMDDIAYEPPGGAEEVADITRALRAAGADIIHVSTRRVLRAQDWGESFARTVRSAAAGPLIVNGGMATLAQAAEGLAATGADLVALARAFLANPDLLDKSAAGKALNSYVPGMERDSL